MARQVGFEPTTDGFEGRCSIQLSYRRNFCEAGLFIQAKARDVQPFLSKKHAGGLSGYFSGDTREKCTRLKPRLR